MRIIITGATGLVATELIHRIISNEPDTELVLVSRNKDRLRERYSSVKESVNITYMTLEDLTNESSEQSYDACVHTAFARSSQGKDVADSLQYTFRLCEWIKKHNVRCFVNISSQSVYGNNYEPFIDESHPCAPDYMYALGKYSAELIIKAILEDSSTRIVNCRLSSVCENARFLRVFVSRALSNQPLQLTAPYQIVSFIDVRDVASAIETILFSDKDISGDFNLGTGESYTIEDVANHVKYIGETEYDIPEINIIIDDKGTTSKIGMAIDKINATFNWSPKHDIGDMIRSLFEMLTNINRGGYPISFKIVYGL